MNQKKRRFIALASAATLFLSGCGTSNPSKDNVVEKNVTTTIESPQEIKPTILPSIIESTEVKNIELESNKVTHKEQEVLIIPEVPGDDIEHPVNEDAILTEDLVHYNKSTYSSKVKEAYLAFTGNEELTILTCSKTQVTRLFEEIINILEMYENNLCETEEDIYLAQSLIRALDSSDNVISLVYNLHNLYVLQFFTVYSDEEAYYELYGELAKSCGNIDLVNSVYEEYNNLACLLHLRTCDLKHEDVSLDTSEGYKYMYECEALPYGPRCTYSTKLILK